ncbi:MAG: AIR synthase-related protein, partial [Desulfotignum sp.]
PIFRLLQNLGNVADTEMQRTFNNGIGMVMVVPEKCAQEVMDRLAAMEEKAYVIGEITARKDNEKKIHWI